MIGVGRACTRRWRRPSAGSRRSARASVSTGAQVPARLDLDLDPPIAGGELALHLRRELVERRAGCRSTRRTRCDRACPPSDAAASGSPRCCANRSHAAISTAAFAMLWPRIAFSAGNTSRGCAKLDAEHARRDEVRDDVPRRSRWSRSCSTDPARRRTRRSRSRPRRRRARG